ncbi:C40 family peptidase [Pilimelia terevasa]|uniref:C40 family peptidase n=1 Tax=Pilimelia terevasa TaxID=53372 RepID=UPI00166BA780|nr:C40 family peptidase [Pilimelia terevasa]
MAGRRAGRLTLVTAIGATLLPQPSPAAAATPLDVQLQRARHQLDAVVEEYNQIRADLASTETQLAELTPRLGPMRRAVEQQRGKVGAIAAGAYRVAASYKVGMLLTANGPHQLTDRILVVTRLADNQQKAVANLDQANHHYRKAQQALAMLAASQYKQRAQLTAKRQHVEGEIYRLRQLIDDAADRGTPRPDPNRPRGGAVDTDGVPAPAGITGAAGRAVRFAYSQIGTPYRFGGSGPDGYDCSGLIKAAWTAAGRNLPHNAAGQRGVVRDIGRSDLRPGDLVFYYGDLSHVALYIGGGRIIHAPTYGENVHIDSLTYAPIHSFGRP